MRILLGAVKLLLRGSSYEDLVRVTLFVKKIFL